MSENKADPLREALKPLAAISLWRDKYQDGPDMLTNDKLARYFTADQVRAARAALAAPQPAAPLGGRHPIEILWREHDLPEWFLGNGGTNTKLYALYDAILAIPQERADRAAIIEECALRLDDSADYEDRLIELIKKDPGLSETGRVSLIEHAVTRRVAFRQGALSIRHLRALAGKETGR